MWSTVTGKIIKTEATEQVAEGAAEENKEF